MKRKGLVKIIWMTVMVMQLSRYPMEVRAANTDMYSVQVHGHYSHPIHHTIEDSGGSSSAALGESMVKSVVDEAGLWETDKNNDMYLSVRFHLMDSISNVVFDVQKVGEDSWATIDAKSTATGDNVEDYRLNIPDEDVVIRATASVEAMGRDVVFFLTFDNKTEGNVAGFAELQEDSHYHSTSVFADSVWMTLFLVIFCANILSGLVLVVFIMVGRSIRNQHRNSNSERRK